MKYFAGILCALATVGLVQARDLWESVDKVIDFAMGARNSWPIYEGWMLGLQQDPSNDKHQCFLSFKLFESDISSFSSYLSAISDPENQENSLVTTITNAPWSQPGTYFKVAKRGVEFSAMIFNVYE